MRIPLEIEIFADWHESDADVISVERVILQRAGLPDLDITDYLLQEELEQAENNVIHEREKAAELARSKREAQAEDRGAWLREIAQEGQAEALRAGVTQRRIGA